MAFLFELEAGTVRLLFYSLFVGGGISCFIGRHSLARSLELCQSTASRNPQFDMDSFNECACESKIRFSTNLSANCTFRSSITNPSFAFIRCLWRATDLLSRWLFSTHQGSRATLYDTRCPLTIYDYMPNHRKQSTGNLNCIVCSS